MATVTITIPDAIIPRLRDAMHWKYPESVGVADGAAFKSITAAHWKEVLREYEVFVAIRDLQVQQQATLASTITATETAAATDSAGIG